MTTNLKLLSVLCVAAAISGFGVAVAEESPIQSRMEAYVVDVDKDGNELVRPAKEVEPGQMIEYRMTYNNVTSQPHSNLVVTAPIPTDTSFVGGSDRTEVKSKFTVSIDGGLTFEKEPVKRKVKQPDGSVKKVTIPPSEYTHVRWQARKPIRGFDSQEYRYRVKVD